MKKLDYKIFLLMLLLLGFSSAVWAANELKFDSSLSGAQEITSPAGGVVTDTTGEIEVEFDKA